MKTRKIALLAALPAAILAANSALAGTEVYGKINVSMQQIDSEDNSVTDEDTWKLISNASRFGIKASTDFGDTGLKGVAKIEYEVATDEGDFSSDELKARNMYAGIQGGFGTVIAGQFDTPLKESQGKVDLFNDLTYGDIKNIMPGENRVDDIIMYSTPKMDSGIAFNLAFMPGEETDDDVDPSEDDGIADYYSASLVYDSDNLYVALAMDSDVDVTDIIRLTAQYKMGDFAIGGIYQTSEDAEDGECHFDGTYWCSSDVDSMMVSASYKMGNGTFKAQYGVSEGEDNITDDSLYDNELTSFSLGYDYALDKKGKVFAYYSALTDEGTNSDDEFEAKTFGVGYEYSF